MKNRKLKSVYGFSDNDLEVNRNGELTPRQVQRLRGRHGENQIIAAVVFILFSLLGAFAIYQLILYFMNPVGRSPVLWLVLAIFGVITVIAVPFSLRQQTTVLNQDLSDGRVEYYAGTGWREKRVVRTRNGTHTYYYVRVGNFNMGLVDEDIYSAYLSEHCYRLYFLPRSRRVVSAEMIECDEVSTPPEKSKHKNESDAEVMVNNEVSYLVYSLHGQGIYTAAIKWYVAQGQPPEIAWQQQDIDAQALHQAALECLPKVESEMHNLGWHITAQKDDGDISGNAAFRRTYTMERVQIEDEAG